jgi:hypothetical protein
MDQNGLTVYRNDIIGFKIPDRMTYEASLAVSCVFYCTRAAGKQFVDAVGGIWC